jgi:hypothetical protein
MGNTAYGKLTAGLIAAWFTVSLSGGVLGWFQTAPGRPPLPLLLAVLIPIGLFWAWYVNSRRFREFVLGLSPETLTRVQAWRIAGFTFLALYTYHILPGEFALPAGWGDMAIGASALIVAARLAQPNHRTAFIVWQILGMTDLTVAVGSGAVGQLLTPDKFGGPGAISSAPMTVLPLSLIPTFAVPLFFILHMICITQARRWRTADDARLGNGATVGAV